MGNAASEYCDFLEKQFRELTEMLEKPETTPKNLREIARMFRDIGLDLIQRYLAEAEERDSWHQKYKQELDENIENRERHIEFVKGLAPLFDKMERIMHPPPENTILFPGSFPNSH